MGYRAGRWEKQQQGAERVAYLRGPAHGTQELAVKTCPPPPAWRRARQQLDLTAVDSGMHAIAVVLDFVQRAAAGLS
jgi:hypothetical protein